MNPRQEILLRREIKKIIKEVKKEKKLQEQNETTLDQAAWFTENNIFQFINNKFARELANDKNLKNEFSVVLSNLIKKRYNFPEVKELMAFISKNRKS